MCLGLIDRLSELKCRGEEAGSVEGECVMVVGLLPSRRSIGRGSDWMTDASPSGLLGHVRVCAVPSLAVPCGGYAQVDAHMDQQHQPHSLRHAQIPQLPLHTTTNRPVQASGNTVAAYYPALFASFIEKAGGKLDKFLGAPGAGGGTHPCVFICVRMYVCMFVFVCVCVSLIPCLAPPEYWVAGRAAYMYALSSYAERPNINTH